MEKVDALESVYALSRVMYARLHCACSVRFSAMDYYTMSYCTKELSPHDGHTERTHKVDHTE